MSESHFFTPFNYYITFNGYVWIQIDQVQLKYFERSVMVKLNYINFIIYWIEYCTLILNPLTQSIYYIISNFFT